MRKKSYFRKALAVVCIAAIAVSVSISVYNYYYVSSIKEFFELNMHISVEQGNVVGVNVDTDAVYFGGAGPGSLARRSIYVTNNNSITYFVTLTATGEISRWVTVSENSFFLHPNESKAVELRALVPGDATPGNHTGKLQVIFR